MRGHMEQQLCDTTFAAKRKGDVLLPHARAPRSPERSARGPVRRRRRRRRRPTGDGVLHGNDEDAVGAEVSEVGVESENFRIRFGGDGECRVERRDEEGKRRCEIQRVLFRRRTLPRISDVCLRGGVRKGVTHRGFSKRRLVREFTDAFAESAR